MGLRAGKVWTAVLAACAVGAAGCGGPPAPQASGGVGDAARGYRLVGWQACGSCHVIPGRAGGGLVGPPLSGISRRTILAGVLPNTPANLALWLRDPQGVAPGNTMPDVGLSARDARDIAAYLYTLE